ncbi:MAG: ABC transporter ATP-binding protein, partial [Clostridia bacterium]
MSYREFLRSYLKGQWGKVALFTFALFGGIAVQLLSPQVIRAFIDSAVAGAELGVLLRLAGWFLVLGLASQAFGLLAAYSSADVGWRATNALRLDLFRHVLYLDMSFHKERTPGELIERVDGDVTHLSNFFSQFIAQVLAGLLLIVGILVLFWLEDWRVALPLTLYLVVG